MPIGVARLLLYLRFMRSMPRAGPSLYLHRDIQSKRTELRAAIFADCARSVRYPIDGAVQARDVRFIVILNGMYFIRRVSSLMCIQTLFNMTPISKALIAEP
jgi:hypothetical protein